MRDLVRGERLNLRREAENMEVRNKAAEVTHFVEFIDLAIDEMREELDDLRREGSLRQELDDLIDEMRDMLRFRGQIQIELDLFNLEYPETRGRYRGHRGGRSRD